MLRRRSTRSSAARPYSAALGSRRSSPLYMSSLRPRMPASQRGNVYGSVGGYGQPLNSLGIQAWPGHRSRWALSSSHTLAGLRRRHRFKAGRRDLLIRPVPGLGEGVQSCERRGAAGAQREVEQVTWAVFLLGTPLRSPALNDQVWEPSFSSGEKSHVEEGCRTSQKSFRTPHACGASSRGSRQASRGWTP